MGWFWRGREEKCKSECGHRKHCSITHIMTREGMKTWRARFCDEPEGHLQCARYQASQSGGRVPFTLLPNGKKIGE